MRPARSITPRRPELRSSLRRGCVFTPSGQARDEGKEEAEKRTRSNGTRVIRMTCGRCHVRPVDWSVDDEDHCDGCYRESRKWRYGHQGR